MTGNKFKKRVYITGLLVISIACFFMYKLVSLHFSDKIQLSFYDKIQTRRGYIQDRNGYLLAVSVERESLFANPSQIEKPAEVAAAISRIADIPQNVLLNKLNNTKRFVWIKRKIDDAAAQKIKDLGIRGLYFKKEFSRVYPHDSLASNIIGFVNVDNAGIEGIEYKFNNILTGSVKSFFYHEYDETYPADITLTIDRFIQYECEKKIEESVKAYNAKKGAIAVLEIGTGRILAVAKYPAYNSNYYFNYSAEARGNYSIVNSFEPGSTLKIIALAALFEYYPESAKQTYFCDGSVEVGDVVIKCSRKHGTVTLNDIIKHSCNVGVIKAMENIKKAEFHSVLKRFGFGEKTGVELPGESAGILREVKDWSGLSKYSIAIGQELSVTSLQLTSAFAAIANDGIYIMPTIIETVKKNDDVIQTFYPRSKGRILRKDIADKILKMMGNVVTSGGTGELAMLDYYRSGGKTGTAQKYMQKTGYVSDKYTASFIGVSPLEKPDVCILVMIDEPQGTIYGGEIAAPVFAEVANRILPYRGVKSKGIIARNPRNIKIKQRQFDGKTMPDFRGLLMADVIDLLVQIQKTCGLQYAFYGSGKVYKQSPDPGTKLLPKNDLALYLRE